MAWQAIFLGFDVYLHEKIILLGFDIYLHEKDQFWPRQGSSDHGDKVPMKIN